MGNVFILARLPFRYCSEGRVNRKRVQKWSHRNSIRENDATKQKLTFKPPVALFQSILIHKAQLQSVCLCFDPLVN